MAAPLLRLGDSRVLMMHRGRSAVASANQAGQVLFASFVAAPVIAAKPPTLVSRAV